MTTKTPRKVNRGARPADKVIRAMRGRGYALASTIVEEFEVAPTTVYDWVALDKLAAPKGDKRPVHFKARGCVWILVDAVRARVEPPTEAAS